MKLDSNSDTGEAMEDEPEDGNASDTALGLSDTEMDEDGKTNLSEADPTEEARGKKSGTTACAVCLEVTDNKHVHYGALCCFSCRAFFRRANQENR